MTFLERAKELVSKMTLDEKMKQLRYESPAIERLGIPAYNWWNECLHGVARSGCATVFPQAIGMAASFNTELMNDVATAISDEARAKYNQFKKFGSTEIYQGLTYWSPNINIFRDPRWGRGHETYGEDPLLTGKMGVAFIKGLQGDGKYRKLDATIKHFAVHSGPEKLRHSFNAVVSKEDMDETYLWAFKYCIDNADPSAVMGAYNRTNGEPCCCSETLLQKILYGEWGFKGYVVSDCSAIRDIHLNHHYTDTLAESVAIAVKNGCQLNCGKSYTALAQAYEEGLIDEETITAAVEKLFETRFRLGMFDDDCEFDSIPYEIVECKKHTALNRKMAQESLVLLKNDGILPISKDVKTIAVIGPSADDYSVLNANYNGRSSRYYTLLRGIQDGFDGKVIYAKGCHHYLDPQGDSSEKPTREAIIAAQHADLVILTLGLNPEMEGEQSDRYSGSDGGDKLDIELPRVQKSLLEAIVSVGKPTILVNVSGSCVNLSYADEKCNAVLQCFYPGAEGGNALADVLFGKVSPSGRLPVTFYRSTDDLPPFSDYSMKNRTYKYFTGSPLYSFGHGLSYSKINEVWYGNEVTITNDGPYDTDYTILKFDFVPHKKLVDFKKIHIKNGEKLTVKFE